MQQHHSNLAVGVATATVTLAAYAMFRWGQVSGRWESVLGVGASCTSDATLWSTKDHTSDTTRTENCTSDTTRTENCTSDTTRTENCTSDTTRTEEHIITRNTVGPEALLDFDFDSSPRREAGTGVDVEYLLKENATLKRVNDKLRRELDALSLRIVETAFGDDSSSDEEKDADLLSPPKGSLPAPSSVPLTPPLY
jgi:hypothetical protein